MARAPTGRARPAAGTSAPRAGAITRCSPARCSPARPRPEGQGARQGAQGQVNREPGPGSGG
eukprot:2278800-Alexandrium_andersonii.AAC.1